MKKLLTLFVAVLLVLTATVTMLSLVSCGTESGGQNNNQGGTKPNGGQGNTEERIPLDLPEKNYETSSGKTPFNILEWSVSNQNTAGQSWIPWEEGHVEEEDGDMLAAAVFDRNAWVEEEYGVEISKEYVSLNGSPSYMQRVTTNASTSANEFQLMTLRTLEIFTLVQEEMYFDMNTYKDTILHTDQPWWVQDSVKSFTLGSHLYVASTEMLLRDKGATATLYFNQTLAKDYEDLPNFFKLVDDKEWTLEEMQLASEMVAHSNDGDDEMNSTEDIWGCFGGDDAVYYMFNAFGYKFAHIDNFGYVEYDYGSTESIKVMQDIFLDFMYSEHYFNLEVNKSMLEDGEHLFAEGKALFNSGLVKETTTKLKNMENLYGILPHPMLNEDQDNYSSLVWVHHDSSVGIPAHTADHEMSAIILEALSWESYYSVYPTFYETILLNRAAKDEDSKRMLQVIFQTRSYDPGQYYDTGSYSSGLHGGEGLLRLSGTGNADIAGMWAKYEDTVKLNMQKVNNWISGNEG